MTDLVVAYLLIGLGMFLLGCMVGYARGWSRKINQIGSFIINYDDPTKELLGFKFEKDLPEIEKSRYISFKVIVEGSPDSNPENS